jgi:hypothetical protein
VTPLRETTTLPEIAERFLSSPNNYLPVVDGQYRLLGLVALQDLKEYLGAGSELSAVIAADIMRPRPPCLLPGQKLLDALPVLLASEQRNVPVVNTPGKAPDWLDAAGGGAGLALGNDRGQHDDILDGDYCKRKANAPAAPPAAKSERPLEPA